MYERDTLKKLAAEEKAISEWVEKNKQEFCEAIGMTPFHDEMLVLALAKLPDFFGGHWTGYKDDIDRVGCDSLTPFLRGDKVDMDELRTAVCLLVQRFNAACDTIHSLKSRPRPEPRSLYPRPRPPFRPQRPR